MDYKEKYEQALERAKYYHDRDNIQFLENIFPELKKNEYEKIRKELISHFNETIDNIRSEEIVPHDAKVLVGKMQKWIVWLEKQDEQKWSEEDEQTFIKSVEALEDFGKFELADWIKEHKNQYLTPQSQWKPSERQKEALLWCIVHLGGADKQTLGELLEELNKL